MVGQRRRDQAPDQVAGDVAGDVGGEGTGRRLLAMPLAEMREGQREGRRHQQPLAEPERGEARQVGRDAEQRRRQGEQREARRHATAAVEMAAEQRHRQRRHRHPQGAGVHRRAHRAGARAIMRRERGQDRLGGEEIDQGEEGRQRDHRPAPERRGAAGQQAPALRDDVLGQPCQLRRTRHQAGAASAAAGATASVTSNRRRSVRTARCVATFSAATLSPLSAEASASGNPCSLARVSAWRWVRGSAAMAARSSAPASRSSASGACARARSSHASMDAKRCARRPWLRSRSTQRRSQSATSQGRSGRAGS